MANIGAKIKEHKIVTTISIEVDLMKKVDEICKKDDMTRSYFYNSLLKLYFGENNC